MKTLWPDAIPQLWERELGAAYSSFAAVGDRVYTCGTENDRQTLLCLDTETGNTIWKNDYAEVYRDNYGDGRREIAADDAPESYVYNRESQDYSIG